jgi:hypothetical protein
MIRLAAIGLVGAVALTGCRADPSVAAYVGDVTITEDRVQALVDNAAQAAVRENAGQPPGAPNAAKEPSRVVVVQTLVLEEVCEKHRAEKNFPADDITPEQVREAERSPASAEFTAHRAKLWSCVYGIPLGEQDGPKEEDFRKLYDRAIAAGQIQGTYEEVRPQLLQNQNVLDYLARARYLTKIAEARDITVNPRYRPLEFPLAGEEGVVLVGIEMGEPELAAVHPEKAA